MLPIKYALLHTWIHLLLLRFSFATDTLTMNRPFRDGTTLVSNRETFVLGFFSPGKSHLRYVGIWYKFTKETVVWVANRDKPLNDSTGNLSINANGNLVLHDKYHVTTPLWSTNISSSSPSSFIAQLLDSGNLVLIQQDTKRVVWQSFDHPTQTILPDMNIGFDKRTGLTRFITSWKSEDDPGTGNSSYRINPNGNPQMILYRGQAPWWRAGHWNGLWWSGIPAMQPNFVFKGRFVNDDKEITNTWSVLNASIFSRVVVDESGSVRRFIWKEQERQWTVLWSEPMDQCDHYSHCGAYGICEPYDMNVFECTCLPGYEPKSPRDWYLRDGSGGCRSKHNKALKCRNGEGFVKVAHVKAPDTSMVKVDMSLMSLDECEKECLRNCSCEAYAIADLKLGGGCLTWHGGLIDTKKFTEAGQDLYVRVDSFTLAEYTDGSSISKSGKVAISVVSVIVCFLVILLGYWKAKRKRKVKEIRQSIYPISIPTNSTYLEDSPGRKEVDECGRNSDLPLFDLSTIAAATGNFSFGNKLGKGGFGFVYKGVLNNGKEIAVKRLSKNSEQGNEEFKNEIMLIAKLQHRNLVSILGCCIQEEEKMLIYEYLPNKSLDFFIYDETNRKLLDWRKRFDIICGVARGILYLHQDSRLRIIHRDLKASNILLDEAMNPKIADFGMARILGEDQIEAKTTRVVGTYGYMSPEYAIKGLFSIKSDVYSFGVLVLEIITGQKNSGCYHSDTNSSLVGHVWDLWRDGKYLETLDSSLDESFAEDASRCIQIGLLCVQEHAYDRPTMSAVVFMLGNNAPLPSPKQPAFVIKRSCTSGDLTTNEGANSINEVTCTMVEAR